MTEYPNGKQYWKVLVWLLNIGYWLFIGAWLLVIGYFPSSGAYMSLFAGKARRLGLTLFFVPLPLLAPHLPAEELADL